MMILLAFPAVSAYISLNLALHGAVDLQDATGTLLVVGRQPLPGNPVIPVSPALGADPLDVLKGACGHGSY